MFRTIDPPVAWAFGSTPAAPSPGAVVNPFYDSLLVKVSAWGRRFVDASRRMERCLQEFRIRGVKTNIPFLIKLITHPKFAAGTCTTRFIDQTPELFHFPKRKDRATRLLTYLGEVIVNGNPLVKNERQATRREPAPVPPYDKQRRQFRPVHGRNCKNLVPLSLGSGSEINDTIVHHRYYIPRCPSIVAGHARYPDRSIC